MKKLKIGIIGYGNLGKEVERQVLSNEKFQLIGIFSRRKLNGCYGYDEIKNFIGKIDIMFLCVGSQNNLEQVAFETIKNFNTVDCYDNHNRLKNYIIKQNNLAQGHKKIALCALGWDPGLFSFMRGLFDSLNLKSYTFWGKGLSQGHTQALKSLPHVIDAVQFTVPLLKSRKAIIEGKLPADTKSLHKRVCYVVCEPQYQKEIKNNIVSMPDYFKGYKTIVKFVSMEELNEVKTFAHKGEVTSVGNTMQFKLDLKSNPSFTASVLITFSKAIPLLSQSKKYGAYTILDLPLTSIIDNEKYHYL